MLKVAAKEQILLIEETGPGPNLKTSYIYVAAERGEIGLVIGQEDGKLLVAFERTRLAALVCEERVLKIET